MTGLPYLISGVIIGWAGHWVWSEYRIKKLMGFYND